MPPADGGWRCIQRLAVAIIMAEEIPTETKTQKVFMLQDIPVWRATEPKKKKGSKHAQFRSRFSSFGLQAKEGNTSQTFLRLCTHKQT
jgi:hypothetical protein